MCFFFVATINVGKREKYVRGETKTFTACLSVVINVGFVLRELALKLLSLIDFIYVPFFFLFSFFLG